MSFEFDQDVILTELMLYAPMDILEQVAEAQKESILADMQEEDAEIFAETIPVRKSGKRTTKQVRKYALSEQERHAQKGRDRQHGKKHKASRKDLRRWDDNQAQQERPQVMWTVGYDGGSVYRPVNRGYHEKRFMPSPDWDGTPDPLMPAERLERNQQIEQLKNQLDITDWEMRDVTDRIQWCREDIEEIEFMKSKEAEVRQSLKEWQDRLNTLSRQYHDLTERILNLSV